MNGLFLFPVSPRLLVLMGTFSFTLYFSDIKLSFKQNNWKNHPLFLLGLGVKRGNTEMENWKILLERRLMHFWGQNHLILWSLSLTSQSDFYSIQTLASNTEDIPLLHSWTVSCRLITSLFGYYTLPRKGLCSGCPLQRPWNSPGRHPHPPAAPLLADGKETHGWVFKAQNKV